MIVASALPSQQCWVAVSDKLGQTVAYFPVAGMPPGPDASARVLGSSPTAVSSELKGEKDKGGQLVGRPQRLCRFRGATPCILSILQIVVMVRWRNESII